MNAQDREVVRALLQRLTEKHLTSSPEFAEAIKHFNISTAVTYPPRTPSLLDGKQVYPMDVYTPETIDENPHGIRIEFESRLEAMNKLEEVIGNGEGL
ncbi:hypothetical protein B7I61_21890 [Salmonella enterica]|nr:hypothetical protein [Salmonella enterica]